jgi:hypothetical protein
MKTNGFINLALRLSETCTIDIQHYDLNEAYHVDSGQKAGSGLAIKGYNSRLLLPMVKVFKSTEESH